MLKTKNSKVQFLPQYNISKLRNSSRSSLLPGIYIRMEINTSCISRIFLFISNNFTVISHFINMVRSVRLARQVVFLLYTKNEPKTDCFYTVSGRRGLGSDGNWNGSVLCIADAVHTVRTVCWTRGWKARAKRLGGDSRSRNYRHVYPLLADTAAVAANTLYSLTLADPTDADMMRQ